MQLQQSTGTTVQALVTAEGAFGWFGWGKPRVSELFIGTLTYIEKFYVLVAQHRRTSS